MKTHYSNLISIFDRKSNKYDAEHSDRYSTMGLHERIRRRLVQKIVDGKGSLLDIGCGPGWYLNRFSKSYSCFGIDISHKMLKQCGDLKNTSCVAYGEALPIKSNSMDCILCINMFQYIKDPFAFLLEIKRVIKHDGICILDFKNAISFRARVHNLMRIILNDKNQDSEKRYSIFEVNKLIKNQNFQINKIIGMEFSFLSTSQKSRPILIIKFLEAMDILFGCTFLKYFSGRLMIQFRPNHNN